MSSLRRLTITLLVALFVFLVPFAFIDVFGMVGGPLPIGHVEEPCHSCTGLVMMDGRESLAMLGLVFITTAIFGVISRLRPTRSE